MHRGMRKPHGLKVRCYTGHLIDLNKYLASFPGLKLTDKIGLSELNESLLNSMPNSWINQAYVQGFYCASITLRNSLICLNTWKYRIIFTKV